MIEIIDHLLFFSHGTENFLLDDIQVNLYKYERLFQENLFIHHTALSGIKIKHNSRKGQYQVKIFLFGKKRNTCSGYSLCGHQQHVFREIRKISIHFG